MNSNGIFVLMDRDGTVIEDTGYPSHFHDVRFLPGALQGLAILRAKDIPVFGATNQSGVGRGFFSLADVLEMNRQIDRVVTGTGGEIKQWYVCPHRPDEGCVCRKPLPGLALQAQKDWRLDLRNGVVIGDKGSDMAFAKAFDGRCILIAGDNADTTARALADVVASDLIQAARAIEAISDRRRP